MGGVVAVGFRFPDGKIVCQERWTNSMPYWLNDVRIFNGDISHLNEYIKSAENHDRIPVAPHGYGLVFVDYISKKFMSMQDYTYFGNIDPISIISKYRDNDKSRFDSLLREKRIKISIHKSKDEIIIQDLPDNIIDHETLLEHSKILHLKNQKYQNY